MKKILENDITATDVADYVIKDYVIKSGGKINYDVMQSNLQDILYFIQYHHIDIHGTPLFEDDFESWSHGPVIRDIYNKYKNLDSNTALASINTSTNLSKETVLFIDFILNRYGSKSPRSLTSKEYTPWKINRKGIPDHENSSKIISKKMIADYCSSIEGEVVTAMLNKLEKPIKEDREELLRRFPGYKPEPISKEILELIETYKKKYWKYSA